MKKVSLVVPCYNEEQVLPIFYREIKKVMDSLTDYRWELWLVDDGSKDQTLSVIKTLSEKDHQIKYISFSRNFGKEAAMYAGLCNANGDYVAVMDADLQDPPALLPQMLERLRDDSCDIVAARRVNRVGEPRFRSWMARRFYGIMRRICHVEIADGARDYRLMKREVADAVVAMGERNRFSKGIFGWVGFRTCWLPYENVVRAAGETKWSFWGLVKYSLEGIMNFSQVPLSVVSGCGVGMTLFAMVMLAFVIIRRLIFGDPVAGWASQVCIMIFIGGIQIFCLGIIGQYIAKMYLEMKQRPHYIVAESNEETVEKIR
ncbi:MAG: glycosyltransferase family 2 protein [Roseburia sp.]